MSYNVRFYESVWSFAVVHSRSNPTLASFYFGYLWQWEECYIKDKKDKKEIFQTPLWQVDEELKII